MPEYRLPHLKDLPPPGTVGRRRVVLVTTTAAGSLEYLSVLQVLEEARIFLDHADRLDLAYDVEIVSHGTGTLFETKGFSIQAERSYDRLRGSVDTLIFQGADEHDECLRDDRFIAWVARMAKRVRRVVSICTGSFILAEAGVLDGRRAATHWCACEDFRKRYPDVDLEPDPIYVKDGHVYTSAGATSAMDLAIALVEEDFGTEFARRVAQGLVMYLRRPGNQAQFSVQVSTALPDESLESEIERYIFDHLDGDLRVDRLAERFAMSTRSFNRSFAKRFGVAPGRFVEQCRLERARQYLEETDKSVGEVASLCGYSTNDGLRLAFERNLGVSPRAYRTRFTSSAR